MDPACDTQMQQQCDLDDNSVTEVSGESADEQYLEDTADPSGLSVMPDRLDSCCSLAASQSLPDFCLADFGIVVDEDVSQTSPAPSSCPLGSVYPQLRAVQNLAPTALCLPFVPDSETARVAQTGQVSDPVVLMTALPKTGVQARILPPAWRGRHDVEGRGFIALPQTVPKRSSEPVSGEARPLLRPPLFAAKPLRSESGIRGYGPVRPSVQLSNRWTPCPTRRERQALAPHVSILSPRALVAPLARPVIRPRFMQTYPEHAPLPRPVRSSNGHHARRPLHRVPLKTWCRPCPIASISLSLQTRRLRRRLPQRVWRSVQMRLGRCSLAPEASCRPASASNFSGR